VPSLMNAWAQLSTPPDAIKRVLSTFNVNAPEFRRAHSHEDDQS